MNCLMTGGNHATVEMSGENFTMHCDSIYYKYQQYLPGIYRLKYVGCSRIINSHLIDTPARLLKLELGAQLPITSLPKLKRDIVKSLKRRSFCGQLNSHGSKYWQYRDESIEYALPNSRSSFFDNSVVQKFEAVSKIHSHYHTTDYIHDTYEYKMMQHSGECLSFCVGGPRYFEAPTIVETFDQWLSWNPSKDFLATNNSYRDCGYVAKSPLYRNQYTHPTNPGMVAFNNNFNWQHNNRDYKLDLCKDADNYDYVPSQLSHLPKAMGSDPGNMPSHIPIPVYSTTS